MQSVSLRCSGIIKVITYGLLAFIAWVVPQLFEKRYPKYYVQCRKWWITAVRLGLIFLPTMSGRPQRLHSTASLLGIMAVAGRVPRMWAIALELRLDFRTHLALNALQSAHVVFAGAHRFCSGSSVQAPAVLRRFHALSRKCSQWAGLLLPFQQPADSPGSSGLAAGQHCLALTVAGHLMFGLYLSSVAVYVSERLDRADFLSREAAALGVAPALASEHLGLPRQEVAVVCLFDPLSEWLRWGMLLPPLAAATWLALAALAPLGAGDTQGTCAG
ncbi:hypothetical protein N2152v2_008820 [Parachlorella kessleri]